MRVTEMTFSRGTVEIGDKGGWVTREFADEVKIGATIQAPRPITWDDVRAMYRKMTPEAYR
jgi:hypothetical protein